MRPAVLAAALVLLALGSVEGLAWTSSGFDLEHCVWYATDIVVLDGEGKILEVWDGGQKSGDRLSWDDVHVRPEQTDLFAGKRRWPPSSGMKPGPPEPVSVKAERVILFLKRAVEDGKAKWKPVRHGNFFGNCSAVWVQAGKLYTWQGRYMTSPQLAVRTVRLADGKTGPQTFESLKEAAAALIEKRRALRRAAGVRGARARANALAAFVTERPHQARCEALALMAACGRPALTAFRSLVFDPKLLGRQGEIMTALRRACGSGARPLLREVIRDEQTYWSSAITDLRPDWGLTCGVKPHNGHWGRLAQAAWHLKELGLNEEDRKLLTEVRRLLSRLPAKDVDSARAGKEPWLTKTLDEVLEPETRARGQEEEGG